MGIIDWYLRMLLAHPKVFIVFGEGLLSASIALAGFGLYAERVGRRIGRVAERAHIAPPDVLAAFPWWFRMWIPETTAGWLFVAAVVLIGISFVWSGKWAKRL